MAGFLHSKSSVCSSLFQLSISSGEGSSSTQDPSLPQEFHFSIWCGGGTSSTQIKSSIRSSVFQLSITWRGGGETSCTVHSGANLGVLTRNISCLFRYYASQRVSMWRLMRITAKEITLLSDSIYIHRSIVW